MLTWLYAHIEAQVDGLKFAPNLGRFDALWPSWYWANENARASHENRPWADAGIIARWGFDRWSAVMSGDDIPF